VLNGERANTLPEIIEILRSSPSMVVSYIGFPNNDPLIGIELKENVFAGEDN
jgi:hypothetical protein